MPILMTTERLLSDGTALEQFICTKHGWPSVKDATDGLCKRWADSVIRLPNGYEDKKFDEIGVKLRVTFTETAELGP